MEAYLDYNATSPVDPEALGAMKPYFTEKFGNASSIHRVGQASRHAVEDAREAVAEALGVEPGDITFTSGGTEADNLALKGVMEGNPKRHLVVSAIEHQAVLHAARALEKSGVQVTIVDVGRDGVVDPGQIARAIRPDTALVSLMHVNNELGTIQPVEAVARLARERGALFHVDAVQSFCRLPLQPEEIGIDLVSVSSHKICGPKGCGALYARKGLKLKAQLHGGHQEKNVRPGTENVPALVGFGRAVRLALEKAGDDAKRAKALRDRLADGLRRAVPDLVVNGHPQYRVGNTLNTSFPGLDGETLLMNLDLKGISVSTGSACTAGSVEPSHVLLAIGLAEGLARAAVRFSVGRFTTDEEIDYALAEIPPIVERLRKASTERMGDHAKQP